MHYGHIDVNWEQAHASILNKEPNIALRASSSRSRSEPKDALLSTQKN